MKLTLQQYCAGRKDDSIRYPSWDSLVALTCDQVLVDVTEGSYQGDYWYLLRRGEDVTVGYGSCSGCDALEAVEGDFDAEYLLGLEVEQRIQWFPTPSACLAYLANKDWALEYNASVTFLDQARAVLLPLCGDDDLVRSWLTPVKWKVRQ